MYDLTSDETGYDDRHYLLLKGLSGPTTGERLKVSLGEGVVLGRSRGCHFSLKKTAAYLRDRDGERARIRESLAFRATSRRHVRLTYLAPDLLEIENLSRNGTWIDGHRVDRVVLDDVRRRAHEVRLGPHGDVVEISCGSVELDVPALRSAS